MQQEVSQAEKILKKRDLSTEQNYIKDNHLVFKLIQLIHNFNELNAGKTNTTTTKAFSHYVRSSTTIK
jgi:hypothetical protein